MGNQCSAILARPIVDAQLGTSTCNADSEDTCGICGDEVEPSPLTGAHPLLLELDTIRRDGTHRTPRGPAPPWAILPSKAPIDLTATGPTPPRSPTLPRASPPGLPDEDDGTHDYLSPARLSASLDPAFLAELFQNARSGSTGMLSSLLHHVDHCAYVMVCNASTLSGASSNALAAERRERVTEVIAYFLSELRCPNSPGRETLLGVAASGGHSGVVQLLLTTRADPIVSDDQGFTALHRAAEGGRLLPVLMVLDRMQANSRAISIADLTNLDGETPEMLAALAGASDVCQVFEVFSDMQSDAETRQLGSGGLASDLNCGHRSAGTGDILAFIDLAAEERSAAGLAASSLLRRAAAGHSLVPNLFRRVPEDESEIRDLVDRSCNGIRAAEGMLLRTVWNPLDPELDPAVRAVVTTAEVRSTWQRLRMEAVSSEGATVLEDFWQTHISAETMVSTLLGARGDTFQLLLTVLWLYTREAWLRHIMDTLACAICANHVPQASSPTAHTACTGATPLGPPEVPSSLGPIASITEALAPLMQLVQSALGWFEEAGIRHTGATYRPLSLPALGLQRLVEKYLAARHESGRTKDCMPHAGAALGCGAWVALGAGTFFSSMSSRPDALERLARTRCNVMLVVRPDEQGACFPKHMSLRGSAVDDSIFPLGALFRIARITRMLSSELCAEECDGTTARWPVMVVEVEAASRTLEVFETLERRGDLRSGELERHLQDWVNGAAPSDRYKRLFSTGELLARCCCVSGVAASGQGLPRGAHDCGVGVDGGCVSGHSRGSSRAERAASLLAQAAALAESNSDPGCAARALLALARCRVASGLADADRVAADGQKAVRMLEEKFGAQHPETCATRSACRELGVLVRTSS